MVLDLGGVVAVGVLLLLVLLPVIVRSGMRSVSLPATVAHVALETQAERMGAGCAAGAADMVAVGAQGHSPAAAVLAPAFASVPFENFSVDIYRRNW